MGYVARAVDWGVWIGFALDARWGMVPGMRRRR